MDPLVSSSYEYKLHQVKNLYPWAEWIERTYHATPHKIDVDAEQP